MKRAEQIMIALTDDDILSRLTAVEDGTTERKPYAAGWSTANELLKATAVLTHSRLLQKHPEIREWTPNPTPRR